MSFYIYIYIYRYALQLQKASKEDALKIQASINASITERSASQERSKGGDRSNESSSSDEEDLSAYAQADLSGERHLKIQADIWISYSHKVFKKVMYTRVVEVRGNKKDRKVVVENGEHFMLTDQVRILETNEDGSCNVDKGFSYKALKKYKFKNGKSKVLMNFHDSAALLAGKYKFRGGSCGLDWGYYSISLYLYISISLYH